MSNVRAIPYMGKDGLVHYHLVQVNIFLNDKNPVECKCARGHDSPTPDEMREMLCCNEKCTAAGPKLVCKNCLAACYCSSECQHKDWPVHKKECTPHTIYRCPNNSHYVNPRSQYERMKSLANYYEDKLGFVCLDYFESISRRYHINWALKSLREGKCFITDKTDPRILADLCSRIPVVIEKLSLSRYEVDWNVLSSNMVQVKNLCIQRPDEIKDWDGLLSFVNKIKPEEIVLQTRNRHKYSKLTRIDPLISVVFHDILECTKRIDPEFDATRKKRKIRVIGILLYTAHLKNEQSPFYHESLPIEMMLAIFHFVERDILR